MTFPWRNQEWTEVSQFRTDTFQRRLANWNRARLAPQLPDDNWQEQLSNDLVFQRLEGGFIEELRAQVSHDAAEAPSDVDGFVAWFENLERTGPGQYDALFDWLAEDASMDEMRWFLTQEAAGEAGFDDLVALTQIKLSDRAKLELARNYWDEMGQGRMAAMHGPMLANLTTALEIDPRIETTAWESLALANAMTAMATTRRYAWHSVGALGVIELTAPGRSAKVAKGLKRLGRTAAERRYFDLHAVLDIKHSEAWIAEGIRPLVEEDPRRARAMAEGALMRLTCGARCFDRYRAHFGI